jgi:Trypsin-like peptidase domain
MTWLDVVILGFAILMAVWGYSLGARTAAVLVCGFVGGAFFGAVVGPIVFDAGRASRLGPMFALTGALLVAAVLGALEILLRPRMRGRFAGRFARLEGPGGAALLVGLGLALMWLVGAVGQAGPSQSVARPSGILAALDAVLPPAQPVLHALGIRPLPPLARVDPVPQIKIEIVPRGPVPQIVTSAPRLGTPDPAIVRDPNVEAARRSVVRVVGMACGLEMQGSGWVARKGIVVTNAHVVAGQTHTRVELQDGSRHAAEVIRYEPRNDLAVLRSYGVAAAGLHPFTVRPSAPTAL